MERRHQVADFNTLEDLIEHAERELDATHVTVELVRGTGRAGRGTKIYFPRGGSHPYEEARVWRQGRYWHAEGPGARTGIQQLPDNAMTIERYLTRGGQRRRAAERHSDPLKQAKDAGEQYARDQIDGDHFRDWVRDQIYEASRMDPSQVLPLETKDDAKVIAKNTLQQLGWDTNRELASFDILKMIGASSDNTDESAILNAFYEGFDEALHDPHVVDWLADEILSTHEQETGRTAEGAEEARRGSSIQWVPSSGGTGWHGRGPGGRTYLLRRAGKGWNLHIEGSRYGPFDSLEAAKTEAERHERSRDRPAEGAEEAKRKRPPEMTGGVVEFAELLKSLVDTQGRSLNIQTEHRLGGPSRYYESVYVNFVNLPTEIVARKAGGGAEAQNNKMSFWVEGFDGADPHAPPPTGKVKVEMQTSALPREYRLRAKTGKPGAIAHYLADFINKVVREVPPKYTHTRDRTTERAHEVHGASDGRRPRTARTIEDETGLIPEAAAEMVLEEVRIYLGVEVPLKYVGNLSEHARAVYAADKNFRKKLKGAHGREHLWSFMRHWLSSDLKKSGDEWILSRMPTSVRADFANGLPLPHEPLVPRATTREDPRSKAPPKRFKSPGGRTFTLGPVERTEPRFEGDRSWQEMWPILYKSEPAGKLFRSETYRAPLEWSATTRELYWKYAADSPMGTGFDVAAFATPKEALEAWGRSADQILDWSESSAPHRRSRKR